MADNVDNMPSLRLFDGDMRMLITVIERLEDRIVAMGSALSAISGEVRTLQGLCTKTGEGSNVSLPQRTLIQPPQWVRLPMPPSTNLSGNAPVGQSSS